MQKQKGISSIIAVILLAIILVSGGTYYFKQQIKPTPKSSVVDATANWKTYTSPALNFVVSYPGQWNVSEKALNEEGSFFAYRDVVFSHEVNTRGYSSITVNASNKNFKDHFPNYKVNFTISGIPAYRVSPPPGMNSPYENVAFKKGNTYYVIERLPKYSDEDILFDEFLSTFKFTDQNQASNALDSSSTDSSDQAVKTYYNTILNCEHAFDDVAIHTSNSSEINQAGQVRNGCNKNANNKYLITVSLVSSNIFCAQNIPQSLTFDKASVLSNGTATVVVHTIWGSSAPGNINVGLQEINNQWKIASINCNK